MEEKNNKKNKNMILSDKTIKEKIKNNEININPLDKTNIQPSSVDLRLGHNLKTVNGDLLSTLKNGETYTIKPNEFLLGSTLETVTLPHNITAMVDGKSSIARLGLAVHITAGFIDPGFQGNITLELKNNSDEEITVEYGLCLCQIIFLKMTSTVENPYGSRKLNSHYQNSKGTVISRYKKKNIKRE